MSGIRVGILTGTLVSDTASRDPTADKSGPTIKAILEDQRLECKEYAIVPDEEDEVRRVVQDWCQGAVVDLLVTTGGTGFGIRDRTPEAITPLLEREAPGLVHLILSSSLKRTPFAALSRPVAGIIKDTLVLTLPGSVKAVRENLEALIANGVLAHAVDLIRGGSGDDVHTQLSSSSSGSSIQPPHHHHHHHHHDGHAHSIPRPRTNNPLSADPSSNVPARQRVSPYPMVSVKDALVLILQEIQPLKPQELPANSNLRGCVLAEDVIAISQIPATPTSNVDGYALRSTLQPGIYDVLTEYSEVLPEGNVIYRVNTGGAIPQGADAVIMVEDTQVHSTEIDPVGQQEEKQVQTLAQIPSGENVRQAGSDVRVGDIVMEKGQVIAGAGGEIGTLAFVGRTKVNVHPKPVVGLLSTGNELRDLNGTNAHGTTWDTNRPSLQVALEAMGYEVVDLGIVPDDLTSHVKALQQGLSSTDILITTGGTSMGTSDLLKPAIEHSLNGTVHFGRVNVKPGKPTTFAMVPTPGGRNESVPVFALPGNPASALVTFNVFVVPALRKLGGYTGERCHLPRIRVKLQDQMRLDPRPEYHRVVIVSEHEGLKAYSTGGQRSSRVASLAGANGLVALPQKKEDGPAQLDVGEMAEAVLIGELHMRF